MKNYFQNCETMEQLKAEYKRQAKVLHPDCGGTDEEMAALNSQYDRLAAILPKTNQKGERYQPATREAPEEFRAAVLAAMGLKGVELELCGNWLWASGNTKEHKAALSAAGYRFSGNKLAWYWHEGGYRKRSNKAYTLDEIRYMHGSEKVKAEERQAIPA